MGSKNEWSEKEKELLITFFPTMGASYCSELTGRSKRGCQEMAKRLKLRRIFKFQDESELRRIIKESTTYTNCVIKLGLSPRCSGNFQTLKKYIKIFDIDISHFDGGKFKNGNIPKNKIDLNNVMKKNSFINRHTLKNRLYKDGLKKKKCEICGIGEDWFNGSKIIHILDHINGDPYDNRIENLRIVCPNCNSTLETNCRGNGIKRIYDSTKNIYKSDNVYKKCSCGEIILKESNFCTKCNGKQNRKVERPPYNQLLKEIEESNYTAVGRKYGVSDNTIRKWIKYYEKYDQQTVY